MDEIQKYAILSAIKAELLDHFGGGFSDERPIRDSEASLVSCKIWDRIVKVLEGNMLVRLTPKSTRFGDDFVGTRAHWMLARLSPLDFGCCHEPVYSPSYVGATACPLIPSNDGNALNG